MTFEVHTVTVPLGALDGDILPAFKVPSAGGVIQLIGAELQGVGSVTVYLVNAGTDGTSNDGTVASFGAGTLATTVPQSMTLAADPRVDAGDYLAVQEASGAFWDGANNFVSIHYVMGK